MKNLPGKIILLFWLFLINHPRNAQGLQNNVENLSSNFYSNPEIIAYHQSGYLVEYLRDKYGLESLKKLWLEGIDKFESIYKNLLVKS